MSRKHRRERLVGASAAQAASRLTRPVQDNHKPAIAVESKRSLYETRDYDRFKFEEGNRDLDMPRVRGIQDSMKKHGNKLHLFPIVVQPGRSGNLIIKDGQHRFFAAWELNLSIFYVVAEEELSLETVRAVNSVQKGWDNTDYLKSFAAEGRPDYVSFKDFVDKWEMPFSQAMIAAMDGDSDTVRSAFRNGTFRFRHKAECIRWAEACHDFKKWFKGYNHAGFTAAMRHVLHTPGYDHDRMLAKMEYLSTELVRCPSIDAYLEVLERIYNYKAVEANRLQFKRHYRKEAK